jgi:hypothetical protein
VTRLSVMSLPRSSPYMPQLATEITVKCWYFSWSLDLVADPDSSRSAGQSSIWTTGSFALRVHLLGLAVVSMTQLVSPNVSSASVRRTPKHKTFKLPFPPTLLIALCGTSNTNLP